MNKKMYLLVEIEYDDNRMDAAVVEQVLGAEMEAVDADPTAPKIEVFKLTAPMFSSSQGSVRHLDTEMIRDASLDYVTIGGTVIPKSLRPMGSC